MPYVCLRIVVDNYLQLLTQFACCFIITLSPKRLHPIRIAVSQVIKDVDYREKTHNKSENCEDNYSLLCWCAEAQSVNEKDCQNTLWAAIWHLNNFDILGNANGPREGKGPSPFIITSLVRKIQFSELNNYIWSKWDCFTFTCSLPQSFAIFHVIVKGSWSVSNLHLYILQCNDWTFRR